MAKALKLPRQFKGATGKKAAGRRAPSLREEAPVGPDAAVELLTDPQESARRLTKLCQRLSNADASLRRERIAAIQKSIAAGTYRISAADLADKLIGHMLMNRPRS